MNPVSGTASYSPFLKLPDELQLGVLSYLEPKDLVSFTETSKRYYELIHCEHALVKKMNKPFLFFEKLIPENKRGDIEQPHKKRKLVRDRKFSLVERAINLIPVKEACCKTESLFLLAQKSQLDDSLKYFKSAYEASKQITRSQECSRQQWLIVKSLNHIDLKLAKQLAHTIENRYFKSLSLCAIDDSPILALETALSIEDQFHRDLALMEIAERFSDPQIASKIEDTSRRAQIVMKLAKKLLAEDLNNAIPLLLKAAHEAEKLDSDYCKGGYWKFRILRQAVVKLRALNSDKTAKVFKIFLESLGYSHQEDSERYTIVDRLKTLDDEMALKAAYSGNIIRYPYPREVFYRLMNIANANFKSNPEKAQKIFEAAVAIGKKIAFPPEKVAALIKIAYVYLRKNDSKNTAKYINNARRTAYTTTYTTGLKFLCLAQTADALAWINREEAKEIAHEVVRLVKSSEYYQDGHEKIIKILHRHFPEQAVEVLKNAFKTFNKANHKDYKFEKLCELAFEMKAFDTTITKLFFDAANDYAQSFYVTHKTHVLLKFAVPLHKVSSKASIALFKMAIKHARAREKSEDRYKGLIYCAKEIAPFYPRIAAGLYQEAYKIKKDAKVLIEIAKLAPEHKLDILELAIEVASHEKHSSTKANHLKNIIEQL